MSSRAELSSSRSSEPQWVKVGPASSLPPRHDVRIHGRRITVLSLRSSKRTNYRAIDSVCYHMGGPLGSAPVAALGGRDCLKCPWHSHYVDIKTGEGLYVGDGIKSRGKVQRVHKVELRDEDVWVLLDNSPGTVRSDEYAYGPKHEGIRTDYYSLLDLDW
eukprot:Plantae.Rhodophyta-Palmaria_palmata.ctg20814.p1 GENE.Plantae.Rhodophyta-Palmaria_palmata.ctg20814~~Plantae.Rhodophyta-Palmaria_palmata.ctg20814.p1  ORF type:complete len:182 (-),score=13.33 Plantae.Rhodophyta-Palmaria_palmata.ctg20814:216-695(-)